MSRDRTKAVNRQQKNKAENSKMVIEIVVVPASFHEGLSANVSL